MIFNQQPQDWQELQNVIGKLFREVGYQVDLSKVVDLVRGKKEIDVFVQDTSNEYKLTFLVECKYWTRRVNKEIIHSFRTVMSDFGADYGFIVSKNGFQKGCIEAVKNTNIRLVTLYELEAKYYNKWLLSMINKYLPTSDMLLVNYWDPYDDQKAKDGSEVQYETIQFLLNAYKPLTSLNRVDILSGFQRDFPLDVPIINDDFEITSRIKIENVREYFDFIELNKEKAIRHFKKLFKEL